MRLLLDTHAFLWAAGNPDELRADARAAIEDSANEVFVSAGVAWEIGIKVGLGKLELPGDPQVWFPTRLRSLGFRGFDITARHALAVVGLPAIHHDPFDRIMIAQALVEGLRFVTRDRVNHGYPIEILDA